MKLNYTFSNLCGVVYDGGNVLYTADGKKLISPVGHRVTVYDLNDDSSVTLPLQTVEPIRYLAVDQKASLLLVVDEAGCAILASLLTHASLTWLRFKMPLSAAPRFSPDGRVLAVALSRVVEIWRVPDFSREGRRFAPWQLVRRFAQHAAEITALEWSDDASSPVDAWTAKKRRRWLTTASNDFTCRVFCIEYSNVREAPRQQNVRPASKKQQADESIEEWNLDAEDEEPSDEEPSDKDLDEAAEALVQTQDEGTVDAVGMKRANRTRLTYRPLVISAHRHEPVISCFYTPEGQIDSDQPSTFLLTFSKEGVVFAWAFDRHTGRLCSERGQKYRLAVDEAAGMSIPGQSDAAADAVRDIYGNTDSTDDEDDSAADTPKTPAPKHNSVTALKAKDATGPGHWARVRSAYFDNGRMLVGFTDGVFGLFRIDPVLERTDRLAALSLFNAETVRELHPGHGIDACAMDQSGGWLAFASKASGQLLVWDWATESFIMRRAGVQRASMTAAAQSPDGQMVATGSVDGRVRLWTIQGNGTASSVAVFAEHVGPITALAFAKQGHILLSASQDGSVRAFDVLRFRCFRCMTVDDATPVQFSALAVDPSGELVAAGTMDSNETVVWSLQTGRVVERFSGHSGPVVALAFDPVRGRTLATGSWDRTVRIWDLYASGGVTAVGEPLSHDGDVLALAFRPDSLELAVATLPGQLVLWDVEAGNMPTGIIDARKELSARSLAGAAFYCLAYTPDGHGLLAAGSFPGVIFYHLPTRTLLRQFPLRVSRAEREAAGHSGKGLLRPLIDCVLSEESRARAVLFAPTGQNWSVLTGDGLLIYSLSTQIVFDPFDLTPDLTPEAALAEAEPRKALVLALRLAIPPVERAVWDRIREPRDVDYVVRNLPHKYLLPLLNLLARIASHPDGLDAGFPLQRLALWCHALLTIHVTALKDLRAAALPPLRILQKAIRTIYHDTSSVLRDNQFELQRLALYALKIADQ